MGAVISPPDTVKAHAKACAQNSPVIPGRLPGFRPLYKPLSWYFNLLARPDFEPLTKAP